MPRRSAALDRAAAAGKRGKGCPPAERREHRVRFWEAIARGASSEGAAVEAGVLSSIGVRWFRKGGGMPPLDLAPVSGRYLSFAEREEIAVLLAHGCGVRGIPRCCGGAGINRHGEGDGRALHRRSSDPRWPRAVRRWS